MGVLMALGQLADLGQAVAQEAAEDRPTSGWDVALELVKILGPILATVAAALAAAIGQRALGQARQNHAAAHTAAVKADEAVTVAAANAAVVERIDQAVNGAEPHEPPIAHDVRHLVELLDPDEAERRQKAAAG